MPPAQVLAARRPARRPEGGGFEHVEVSCSRPGAGKGIARHRTAAARKVALKSPARLPTSCLPYRRDRHVPGDNSRARLSLVFPKPSAIFRATSTLVEPLSE